MKNLHHTFVSVVSLCIGFMVFGAARATYAQVPGIPPSQLNAEEKIKAREAEMKELPGTKRDPSAALAEVNDDLSRLNALNDIFTTALSDKSPLDYAAFSERASEVKARSTRLRTNLALPVDEKAQKVDPLKGVDMTTLQPSLSVLNKLLTSFTHNPIFSDAGAVDMQLAGKAKQDLDNIVVVSEKVRKVADKLGKVKN